MISHLRRLALTMGLLAALPASAQDQSRIAIAYDVYTGGLQVVEFGLDLALSASRYDVLTRIKTRGLYGTLFPWEQVSRGSGQVAAAKLAPLSYEQRGQFRGRERVVEFGYANGRVADVRLEPTALDDNDREPVLDDQLAGVVDPLAGVLGLIMRINGGGHCAGRYEGFDGRRRFNIEFVDRGMERVEVGRPVAFAGDARGCDFVYRQTGGFVRRVTWGADRQRVPQLGRVWLANVVARLPIVPVKIEVESNWGRTIAYMRKLEP